MATRNRSRRTQGREEGLAALLVQQTRTKDCQGRAGDRGATSRPRRTLGGLSRRLQVPGGRLVARS